MLKIAVHFSDLAQARWGRASFIQYPSHQRSSTMNVKRRILSCSISALVTMVTVPAFADCSALPDFSQLRSALVSAITPAAGANGGLGFNMWGADVAQHGNTFAAAR